MPFSISATTSAGVRTATRNSAASAIVLAIKWAEQGAWDVLIAPPDGLARDYRKFQAQHYGLPRPSLKRPRAPAV